MKLVPTAEDSAIIYLGDDIDEAVAEQVSALSQYLRAHLPNGLIECVPSYTSVWLRFHPRLLSHRMLAECLQQWQPDESGSATQSSGKRVELPVYYHSSVAPDLTALARACRLTVAELIAIHSSLEYRVYAIGFAPGFAFMGKVDPRIQQPRHASPRPWVMAGSLAIANAQTAIYPADSPGGWQIIGNCPQPLFSPEREPMMPYQVGDRVRFTAIDKAQYLALGGKLWPT